jgi:hypothetical protein
VAIPMTAARSAVATAPSCSQGESETPSPQPAIRVRLAPRGGWIADRKDEIVESKGDPTGHILGAKGLAELLSYDFKAVLLDIDSKENKDISSSTASNKFLDGNQDDEEIFDGPVGAKGVSVISQGGLTLSEVVRSSAAIMTAGGAGLDDRTAIISSFEISATGLGGDENSNIDSSVPAP